MTMIAFATYGNRAEFMTDSISYTSGMESLGRSTKHLLMPHVDAAVLSSGDNHFGVQVKTSALMAANDLGTFDEVADEFMQPAAQMIWKLILEDNPEADHPTVFLIGFSESANRFMAYQYAARHDFERVAVKGLFVSPAPWSARPSPLEVEGFREHLASRSEISDERTEEMVAVWTKRRPLPPPASTDEWVDLAMDVREQRALEYFSRIPVGGDVFHTVLGRGRAHTDRIHRYNDEGDEFARLVQNSFHPVALAVPCKCESGKSFGDCCCDHSRRVAL